MAYRIAFRPLEYFTSRIVVQFILFLYQHSKLLVYFSLKLSLEKNHSTQSPLDSFKTQQLQYHKKYARTSLSVFVLLSTKTTMILSLS